MTTQEVANALVAYCRNNQEQKAYEELYSPEITSIEMAEPMKEVRGFEGIKKRANGGKKTLRYTALKSQNL